MPVLHNGDEFRRHDNDDYSFVTRSDRSRDFARRRRFGNDDNDDHAMSQVSLPLRISKVGGSTHRSYSPYEEYSPPRRSSSYSERGAPMSGVARQALALCGELDESDPYYKARRLMTSPYYDDVDDEEYVIVMQRRRKHPHPARSVYAEDVAWQPRRASGPLLRSHEEDMGSLYKEERQRKSEADENIPLDYTVPLSRRHDEGMDEEEPMMREMTSYLAKRKQFAIEDDEDMQQLKNQKYQYRTRGPLRRLSDADENITDRSGDFAQAPMFVIKIRSHVIWEKMYVKFTCTIRGSPEPKVTWYHNMVAIDPTILKPGTMRISNQFGVHTLEIFQACLDDSGTYRVSAQNHKGEISSYATLVVRRYDKGRTGYYDVTSGYNLKKPTDYPDVEKLDVPDLSSSKRAEVGEDMYSNQEVAVKYSGKSVEVGEGKYESVLQLQIPGRKQSLDGKQLSVVTVETKIEPVKRTIAKRNTNNQLLIEMAEDLEESKPEDPSESRELTRDELSNCLSTSIEEHPGQKPGNHVIGDDIVREEIKEAKVLSPAKLDDERIVFDNDVINDEKEVTKRDDNAMTTL